MNLKIANIIGTYFGLGLSKYAPGTVGSLGSLPLAYLLVKWGGFWGLIIACLIIFAVGVWAVNIIIKETGNDDPSKVVIDETVGQLLAFSIVSFLAPEFLLGKDAILYYVCGFAFFRFFDIVKMGPVKYFDTKVKNAYGVMLDDVFAGILASTLLLGVLFFRVNM
ncbi:MAG: phosphatidylglycerophosphatase A [Alphaproteobacteria bacterium]|nr:phosphatidylglycerophosphatase A [Alphaproteobacteria bacterium]